MVSKDANVDLQNVFVLVASLDQSHEADVLQVDASKRDLENHVAWVLSECFTDVLACLAAERVIAKIEFADVVE